MTENRTGQIQPTLDLDEHLEVDGFSGKKVIPYFINPDGSADMQENPDKSFRADYSNTDTIYLGWASAGATTNTSSWKITKYDLSTTDNAIQKWADGDTSYDNIWDNRTSLTYS